MRSIRILIAKLNRVWPAAFLLFACTPAALLSAQRIAMNYQGAYSSGTTYQKGDAVAFGPSTYVSLIANNTGNTPAASLASWSVLGGSADTSGMASIGTVKKNISALASSTIYSTGTVTYSSGTYTALPGAQPPPAFLVAGQVYFVHFPSANPGAASLVVGLLAAKPIKVLNTAGTALTLAGGEIAPGGTYVYYDGSEFTLSASSATPVQCAGGHYATGNAPNGDANCSQAAITVTGLPTGCTQYPCQVSYTAVTGQTATVANTTFYTPAAAGVHRITFTARATTAGSAGTVELLINTNNNAAQVATGTADLTTTTGSFASGVASLYTAASQAFGYQTTVAGATGSPQYRIDITVERLQ